MCSHKQRSTQWDAEKAKRSQVNHQRSKDQHMPRKKRGKLHKQTNKHKPIEEKVVTKELQKEWEELRETYELFRHDALIPTATNRWTSGQTLYEAYGLYCKALNIPNYMTIKKLGTLLRENFVMKHRIINLYGCVVRDDLFVREEDVIKIAEA